MPERKLGLWDYVKKAFTVRPHIKGLGEVPVNLLAVLGVGVLGLVNPGFWILGAGLEFGYLALVSSDPRFQKWVEAMERTAASGDQVAHKEAVLSGLSEPRQARYRALEESCSKVLDSARSSSAAAPLAAQTVDGLNRLLWIFLKLLVQSQMLQPLLSPVEREKVSKEIAVYEKEFERASQDPAQERVAKSLGATLEIARKRLANLDAARDQGQFIQAELHRIEQQVALMLQEAALSRDSGFLTERVDSVMQTINTTQDWMKTSAQLLGPVDEDLDTPPPIFQAEG